MKICSRESISPACDRTTRSGCIYLSCQCIRWKVKLIFLMPAISLLDLIENTLHPGVPRNPEGDAKHQNPPADPNSTLVRPRRSATGLGRSSAKRKPPRSRTRRERPPVGRFPGRVNKRPLRPVANSHVNPARCAIFTGMATPSPRFNPIRPAGFLLLFTGWVLVLSALVLLPNPSARAGFTAAGVGVELLGLVLVVRSHIAPKPERH